MTDYKLSAIHPLRRVLWSLLRTELGWDPADYDGLVPILTPQQQPEFNLLSKPYIVYNYGGQGSGEQYWLREEQATFVIYSEDEEEIRDVITMMEKWFSGYDLSADYVNKWISQFGRGAYEDGATEASGHKQFNFKWVRVVSTIGAGPSQQEGGRQSGVVTLRYQFTQDPTINIGSSQPTLVE